MEKTRIVEVIREQGGTTYVTEKGTYIKKTANSFAVYDGNPRGPHKSIHFDVLNDGSLRIHESGSNPVMVPASIFK